MTVVEPDKMHSGGSLAMVIYDVRTQELLPASVAADGTVMSEWELTEDEQERLFSGGRLRLWLRLPIPVTKGAIPIGIEALEPEE